MLGPGLAGLLAGLAFASPALAASQVVNASGNRFVPDAVSVEIGDTVTISNPTLIKHSLKWFDQAELAADGNVWTTNREFSSYGTFSFYCKYHTGMQGKVAVVKQVYTWEGGDGAWTDAAKWAPDGVPGGEDTAVVAGASTVTVGADTTVGHLSLSGGATRAGAGTLTVTGGGTWNDASLTGGRTLIAKGAHVHAGGLTVGKSALDAAVLEVDGGLSLTGDVLDASFGASLLRVDGSLHAGGDAQIVPRLQHSGNMSVSNGTLQLKGSTLGASTGDVWIDLGAALHIASGTYTAGESARIDGLGSLVVGPGALTAEAGSLLTPAVLDLGGVLALDGVATIGALHPGGGKRLGAGTMTVTGGIARTGNALFDGNGVTIVNGDRTIGEMVIQLDGGHRMRFTEDLTVLPTAHLLIGNGTGDDSGTFEVGGRLVVPSERALGPSDGTGVMRILPGGSFDVPTGGLLMTQVLESEGTTTITGKLDAPNGAEVAGGTTTLDGTFTGGALHLTGGTLTGSGVSEEAVRVTGGTLAPVGTLDLAELHMPAGTLAVTLGSAGDVSQVAVAGLQSTHLGGTLAVTLGFTPATTDEFRVVQTERLPEGTFGSVAGAPMKVRTDATGAVLHGYVPPPVHPDPVAPDPAPPARPPAVTPSTLPRFGALVKLPKCAARRRVRVQLLAPATVRALLGRKQLKKSAKSFTLKRLPKRAFSLKFEVTLPDGRMVKGSKRFRGCKAS